MDHPYKEFENLVLWHSIDAVIVELEVNRDITLTTAREYVVGALVKAVLEGYSDFGEPE